VRFQKTIGCLKGGHEKQKRLGTYYSFLLAAWFAGERSRFMEKRTRSVLEELLGFFRHIMFSERRDSIRRYIGGSIKEEAELERGSALFRCPSSKRLPGEAVGETLLKKRKVELWKGSYNLSPLLGRHLESL